MSRARSDRLTSAHLSGLTAFLAAHGGLILAARSLSGTLEGASGAMTLQGTLVAASKLCVLAPTILLFPLAAWRKIASTVIR